ncbi:Flagellar protein [Luteimonas sp. 9C]|uniref:flagellar biosynthetic protein FliO n=1 Tax=Luteimonas sp. 9C TaxID=2653148 RepID=UPI0012F2D3E3|nr:flagellar biosynthetic protein FliO [Luteimonas sp. 9C]VXC08312.1 Flagellar protein [Luteimonas sp. 9C]
MPSALAAHATLAAAQAPVAIGSASAPDAVVDAPAPPATAFGVDAFVVDMPAATAPATAIGAQAMTAAPAVAQPLGRPSTDRTAQVATPGSATTVASASSAGSIGGAVLALVLVVGLIVALGWFARRMPGIGGASNPALRVLGSLSLGPRERVVVVAVGDTQLLVGTGATGTRVLHTLDTPLPVPEAKPTPVFAQVLAQQFGKKKP